MTLVVGLVQDWCVYMGADSAEAEFYDLTVRRDSQLFCKGPFLFGFPGSLRMGDLLRYTLALPGYEPGSDLHRFIVEHIATRMCEWIHKEPVLHRLKANAKGRHPDIQEREGLLLVGCRGHLFTVGPDCQVVEPLDNYDYDALGTGAEVALGALYATRGEDPVQRVYKALHAAERLSGQVRPPFRVRCLEPTGECKECQGTHPHLRAV